ncbi:DsbA family protein [Salinisphaera sp. USBA-960]|uniref:DsbA family protein n=1 Tax=Salinisphaera orenii TaxID=856731 RepID=UPI000DBE78C3|nr:DsbA family protein [Salifodinibacter halophilus]NNC27145.1 DsbA family protein [Salifodinibacter halophilus]
MSDDNPDRRRLIGAFAIPVFLVGILIIVALLILSAVGNGSRQSDADNSKRLSAATMKKFRQNYDQRGVAIGSKSAPVTIREFGDYQCPACGAFAPVAKKIRKQLVASGKVRYLFFDFPLSMHQNAPKAAVAARCAARQGDFWAYHDRLYATQAEWSESDKPMGHFLDLAVEAGVNTKTLKQCVANDATQDTVNAEKKVGQEIGVRATPTLLIGNRVITGGKPYEKIKELVSRQANKG